MKILLTAGATREPIDGVRFLSNISTGRTGAALADALAARGHAITLLRGEGATAPSDERVEPGRFSSAEDLRARLQNALATGEYDAVIMTAAVADYRPESTSTGKLSSDLERLTIHCVRNPKLLPQLKSFSPRPLCVVGFKLTVGADLAAREAAVQAQLFTGAVDFVVHNDLTEFRVVPPGAHPFRLFSAVKAEPLALSGVDALASALSERLARWNRET